MKKGIFPIYGRIGFLLLCVFWYLNWYLPGLRTHLLFFPLWLSYILFIDGLVFYRKRSSLIHRNKKKFGLLFLISIPVWWMFELINLATKNWFYVGVEHFSDIEYFILASIAFSTVMPAVFETSELVSTFRLSKYFRIQKRFGLSRNVGVTFVFWGVALIAGLILYPKFFYPFIWLILYLLVESVNLEMRNKTLLYYSRRANWRPIISLVIGSLICGFLWEFWNSNSFPQWNYNLPYVNFLHIFEMPALGYLGYPFFAFELYAIYHFVTGFSKDDKEDYIILYIKRSRKNSINELKTKDSTIR